MVPCCLTDCKLLLAYVHETAQHLKLYKVCTFSELKDKMDVNLLEEFFKGHVSTQLVIGHGHGLV